MNTLDTVRSYFDRAARRFDAIYEDEKKPLSQRVVDRVFRAVVLERFHLITNLAPLPGEWSVLDVGCGPGRYAIALARAGARVTGVDVSPQMIGMARAESEKAGLADRCQFVTSAFAEFAPPQATKAYDVSVATGYFDYLAEPEADLRKMLALTRVRAFATFPKRWEVRVPVRRLRFALAGGFVRFYAREEVTALFAAAGLPADRLSLVDLGRDYVAIARTP
ncbi:MAG TPA: methyltransferase domain-containing protein [Vicinamibacteria bacterium]|nr:methyltransferase domain-containing protein [Vicinamibacteria bacterium]